jgi:TRAP-type C4-dicarboxylate transport system permease small subunit
MKTAERGWLDTAGESTAVVSSWFERIGLLGMGCMALTTLIDVIGSKLFQRPLPGSTEITGIIQIMAIAGGMAFSKIAGSQIRVDFIFDLLPERGKAILDVFGSLLGLAFFAVAGWMSWENAVMLFGSGTKTFLLGIPLYPFAFWIAVCCVPMFFVIFFELITSARRMVE